MSQKIFCLGLPRTGTTSLHLALVMLGIPSIHRPIGMAYEMFQGRVSPSFLNNYDAFSDLPIPSYHRELKLKYPDALFILTERDEQEWVESIKRFLIARPPPSNETILRDMLRLAMFGRTTFEEERFRNTFRRHHDEVFESFQDNPKSLLRINVADENSVAQLSRFVGVNPRFTHLPRLREPNLGNYSAVGKQDIAHISALLLEFYMQGGENFEKFAFN